MVIVMQIPGEEKNRFVIKSEYGIWVKKKEDETGNSLYIYKKGDKKKESIGIVKADDEEGKITFKLVKEDSPDGIVVETNKNVDISSIGLKGRKIFFVSPAKEAIDN